MFNNKNKKVINKTNLNQEPISTIIGEGVSIEGHIKSDETIRVDGKVTGDINVKKGIILGEKSNVQGNLITNSLVMFGKIVGDVECKEFHIKSTGSIKGNIQTESLEIELGGMHNGNTKMLTPEINKKEITSKK